MYETAPDEPGRWLRSQTDEVEENEMEDVLNTSFKDMPQSIQDAIKVIVDYGDIDGSHHKQWILDQALRYLMGNEYQEWRDRYDLAMARNDYSIWDEGVAP